MGLQIFMQISLKLWPVDVGEKQGDRNKKIKTDKLADVPPKPEVLSPSLIHVPLDTGGGT